MSDKPTSPCPNDTALVGADGWVPSCNFEARRGERAVDMLLIHYTATPTNDYALQLLTTPEGGVSSHYLVDGEGGILQLVAEADRAYHAGEALWAGESDVNSCSIGIEIQNQGAALARVPAYGRAQMAAVRALCADIVKRHNIPKSRVLGHSDVAPHRKQDPGAHFDWKGLAADGIGHWVEPKHAPSDVAAGLGENDIALLQEKLRQIGYGVDVTGVLDGRSVLVITAFQRHYRPALVSGIVDLGTLEAVDLLLDAIDGEAVNNT